jgi:hypothetical protein
MPQLVAHFFPAFPLALNLLHVQHHRHAFRFGTLRDYASFA